jgi:hypothetical protein
MANGKREPDYADSVKDLRGDRVLERRRRAKELRDGRHNPGVGIMPIMPISA